MSCHVIRCRLYLVDADEVMRLTSPNLNTKAAQPLAVFGRRLFHIHDSITQNALHFLIPLVPVERIELPTFGLQNRCTTAVLHRLRSPKLDRD